MSSRKGCRSFRNRRFLRLFAARLKKSRKQKGYSQEEFARIAGFSRSYYTEIETGKRNVSLLNFIKIVQALGIKPGDLLDFVDLVRSGDAE